MKENIACINYYDKELRKVSFNALRRKFYIEFIINEVNPKGHTCATFRIIFLTKNVKEILVELVSGLLVGYTHRRHQDNCQGGA